MGRPHGLPLVILTGQSAGDMAEDSICARVNEQAQRRKIGGQLFFSNILKLACRFPAPLPVPSDAV